MVRCIQGIMLNRLHTGLWKKKRSLIILLCVASLLLVLVGINNEGKVQSVMQLIVTKNLVQYINAYNIKDQSEGGSTMDQPKVDNDKNHVKLMYKTKDQHKFDNTKDIVDEQKCKIPALNPYDPEIAPFLLKPRMEKCKNRIYGVVEKDKLKLKLKNVVSVYMYYINRVTDFKTTFSKKIPLFGEDVSNEATWLRNMLKFTQGKGKDCDIEHQIIQDHFKLVIVFPENVHEEYHYSILDKSKEWGIVQTPPDKQLNILVVLVDSLSHSHTQRSFKNTYKYLSEHPRTVIMKGQNIVGDGTTAQVTAMLTGVPERDHPEARRGFKGATSLDRWHWLYNDLHKRNYVTVYSEEDHKSGLGTFWYRLLGFDKIPTVYYPRPLWRAMKDWIYNQISCPHKYLYKYIRDLFDGNKDYNKFGMIFHNILHSYINTGENADDDTVTLLKDIQNSVHGNNTVVFFMGDHGLRTSEFRGTLAGKLEERLPMLAITYPPKFEAFKAEVSNLRTNSRLLTSHFDLYNTFQHISTFPQLNEKVHSRKFGRSLFTDIGRLNRSCADAGVDSHWCTCLNYKKVDPSKDELVNQLIEKILSFINKRNEETAPGKCQTLKLKTVTTAGRRTPNAEVNQFEKTKTNVGGCDSCQAVLDKTKKFSRFVYEVVFTVSPNNSIAYKSLPAFEAGGEIIVGTSGVEIKIDPTISRINLYGKQPDCIADKFPHLRYYCFCKDFKDSL